MLVAATGVGAGDLATATFSGTHLGTAILWAVLVGAALKYLLNEGLTRWQLATGTTILEGAVRYLGRPVQWIFMAYLIGWSYLVAMALMSACGIAAQAILPFEDPSQGKIFYGILHSVLAAAMVLVGGYRLFERVMNLCVGVMFVTVVTTAVAMRPSLSEVLQGLLIPRIPEFSVGGLEWTIALLGGVGGTVTILCYGYWIREEKRITTADLRICRIDLAAGYSMTAVFGLAMVIIGSQLGQLDAKGANLLIEVGETLQGRLGQWGQLAKWFFLVGAWGAVFSSLLGVWQSVPYLFADFWRLLQPRRTEFQIVSDRSWIYRVHLLAITVLPISGLFIFNFSTAMKVNGIMGALFIPMLAIALLILNGRGELLGENNKNSPWTSGLLYLTLAFFIMAGIFQISNTLTASS